MSARPIPSTLLLMFLLVASLCVVAAEVPAPKQPTSVPDTLDGLQIAIDPVKPAFTPDEPCEFRVTLKNVGDKDLVLNLGVMLANGQKQYATAIQLLWTEDVRDGGIILFRKSPAGVAGRMDDLIVPLPVGASYSLSASFKDFWCPAPKRLKLEPRRGRYDVAAVFKGSPAKSLNADTQGLGLMTFWSGKVTSKPATFEIAGKIPDERQPANR